MFSRLGDARGNRPVDTTVSGARLVGIGANGRILLVVSSLFLAALRSFGFVTDPADVDQAPAFCFEGMEFSRYAVDKNFNQFAAGFRYSHHRTPNADETAAWFRVFVAQMALKARLAREGWLNRPDISANVARMSRYILTKRDGPLYEALYDRRPASRERVQAALAMVDRSFDAFIVRFDDEQTARRVLAAAGSIAAFSALGTLARNDAESSEVHAGWIHWPFHPFEEIADDLARAAPGQTLGPLNRGLGVYYAIVHNTADSDSYGPGTFPGMERAVRALDDDLLRRRRRTEILRQARFAANPLTISAAIARLHFSGGPRTTSAPDLRDALASAPLASYEMDGATHLITAQTLAESLGRRILPRTPRTAAEVIEALREIVVEEFDLRAAQRLGLDRTPRFVEDQRNFALNQVLAAYEQEHLLPRLHPNRVELEAFATAHRDAYLASVESVGALYIFADESDADETAVRLQKADADFAAKHALGRIDPFFVRRSAPRLLAHLPNQVILAAEDGALFGPFAYEGKPALFLKRASGGRVELPYSEIESQVRRDLLRARLDEVEIALLRENGAADSVQVLLDPAKYGLPTSFMFVPTSSPISPGFRSDLMRAQSVAHPIESDQKTKTQTNNT